MNPDELEEKAKYLYRLYNCGIMNLAEFQKETCELSCPTETTYERKYEATRLRYTLLKEAVKVLIFEIMRHEGKRIHAYDHDPLKKAIKTIEEIVNYGHTKAEIKIF